MIEPRLTKLYLARHGESVANREKRVSGQIDTPLSPKGLQQAQWLCEVLQNEKLNAIFTSSLSRTIATAEPTASHHGLEIQVQAGFDEINFGNLQGRKHHQVSYNETVFGGKKVNKTNLDGESPEIFADRVEQALTNILKSTIGTALIVGHRKTNEVILAKLLQADLTVLLGKPVNIKNKYIYEIDFDDTPKVNTIRLGGEYHGRRFAGIKDD